MNPSEDLTDIRLAGRLARQMAHDLNNVAAILSGHVFLLRTAAEPLEEGLDSLEKAGDQLARMTHSLSALASLGEGPVAPFDLNELAQEKRREPSPGRAAVDVLLEPGLPMLRGRRGDVRRALEALLANAREASLPGQAVVVRTRRLPEAGAVLLEVLDAGAGVAPGSEGRAFDPLFSTRGEKGRGIGLTLAAAVAAMHGGACTLENVPEGGTAAVLRFPI